MSMHYTPICYVQLFLTCWLWTVQISTAVVSSCEGSALEESLCLVETHALCWLVAVPHYVGSSPDKIADNRFTQF